MSSISLAGLKTTIERTKQKILSKGNDDAEDTEYFQEKEKVLQLEQIMTRINKRSKKSLEIFQEMTRLQNEIAADIQSVYAPGGEGLHEAAAKLKETTIYSEAERLKMAEKITNDVVHPVDEYCAQFKELKKRTEEYSARRAEMEKHKNELAKVQEKGAAGKSKLPMAEEKCRISQQSYDELREELLRDFPALYNDRSTMLGFILAATIKGQSAYFTNVAHKYAEVTPLVSSVDERAVLTHDKVVTPADRSAAATNLRAHPVFNKDKTPGQPQAQSQFQSQPASPPPFQQQNPTPSTTTQPSYSAPPPQTQSPPSQPRTTTPPLSSTLGSPDFTSIPLDGPNPSMEPSLLDSMSPFQVQALYDFHGSEENELPFKKGETITIIAKHGDWWEGELRGNAGLLPSNYVRPL